LKACSNIHHHHYILGFLNAGAEENNAQVYKITNKTLCQGKMNLGSESF